MVSELWALCYAHFFYMFYETDVGHFWASVNCLWASFVIGWCILYLLKPWGLTSWNRNLVKNRERLRQQYIEELADQLRTTDAEVSKRREWILSLQLSDLVDNLQRGKISAVDALDAYKWKAVDCQLRYNCVTEFIKESDVEAKALDERYANNNAKPALFGVPFSVKDNFQVLGYDTTRGLAKELEKPADEDCSLVAYMRSLGAVPFAKTNVPMTLMGFVCSNPVFGTTLNPHDRERSPGGSSGGEACLVAAGGVPLGIGSDVGGSLRIPAAFCGVFSIKFTSGRLQVTGAHGGVPGLARLSLGYGFFALSASTIELLCKQFLQEAYFERVQKTVPLLWRESILSDVQSGSRKLRVGYVLDDGWFTPVPACQRAVELAKRALTNAGHELIPFAIPNPMEAYALVQRSTGYDNNAYLLSQIEYESVDKYMKQQYRMFRIPFWLRRLLARLVQSFWPRFAVILRNYISSIEDCRKTNADVDAYAALFAKEWQKERFDAVICPSFPFPAVTHDIPQQIFPSFFAVALYNMLDYPAGIVPITKVSKADLEAMASYPRSDPAYKLVHKAVKGSENLPVTVQVIAMPYREELCVSVMKLLEKHKVD